MPKQKKQQKTTQKYVKKIADSPAPKKTTSEKTPALEVKVPNSAFRLTPTETRPLLHSSVDDLKIAKQLDPFDAFCQRVSTLLEEINVIESHDATHFCHWLERALACTEMDIYLSPIPAKEVLLRQLPTVIAQFFEKNATDMMAIAQVLHLLSKDNVRFEYDAGWLYEERKALFKDTVQKLAVLFHTHLKRPLPKTHTKISLEVLATVLSALSLWHFKPTEDTIEDLIQTFEKRTEEKMPSPATAFQFLDAITRLSVSRLINNNPKRSHLLATLAERALTLLLADPPPLKMFPAKRLVFFRISALKRLLPEPSPETYQKTTFLVLARLKAGAESVSLDELLDELPEEEAPHRALMRALNAKEGELWDDSESRTWHTDKTTYRAEGKTHFFTDTYVKYIKHFQSMPHPKGLQWHIVRYSEAMLGYLKSGFITYPLAEIRNYLKILRHCVFDVDITAVKAIVKRLGEEALADHHTKDRSSAMALDLLWLNLVMSTVLQDPTAAYSPENQQKLFRDVLRADAINESQAHALYQIQALQWHGGMPFSPALLEAMKAQWKNFPKSVSASDEERFFYAHLKTALPPKQRDCLKANMICEASGQEIDITYVSGRRKIAIHVDGPSHCELVTKLPTLKTRFRNRCLAAAGWTSLNIDLLAAPDPSTVIARFKALIQEEKTPTPTLASPSRASDTATRTKSMSTTAIKTTTIPQTGKFFWKPKDPALAALPPGTTPVFKSVGVRSARIDKTKGVSDVSFNQKEK